MKRIRAYILPLAVIGTLAIVASLLWTRWPRQVTHWVSGVAEG